MESSRPVSFYCVVVALLKLYSDLRGPGVSHLTLLEKMVIEKA